MNGGLGTGLTGNLVRPKYMSTPISKKKKCSVSESNGAGDTNSNPVIELDDSDELSASIRSDHRIVTCRSSILNSKSIKRPDYMTASISKKNKSSQNETNGAVGSNSIPVITLDDSDDISTPLRSDRRITVCDSGVLKSKSIKRSGYMSTSDSKKRSSSYDVGDTNSVPVINLDDSDSISTPVLSDRRITVCDSGVLNSKSIKLSGYMSTSDSKKRSSSYDVGDTNSVPVINLDDSDSFSTPVLSDRGNAICGSGVLNSKSVIGNQRKKQLPRKMVGGADNIVLCDNDARLTSVESKIDLELLEYLQ